MTSVEEIRGGLAFIDYFVQLCARCLPTVLDVRGRWVKRLLQGGEKS